MPAWTFQDHRQKQKLGDKTPWSVGWIDPNGKRRSKRIGSKSMAEKSQRMVEGQLAAGTYKQESRKSWADFRTEYETKIAAGMEPETRTETLRTLDHFERIAEPGKVAAVNTQVIDGFVAKRRIESGRKRGDTVSPATVNKDLRHLKAVLRIAHEWGYLPKMPRIRIMKEPKKLIRYVTPDHFAAIYAACDSATLPRSDVYTAADWWRALVVFLYMTGWRVNEPLALR